MSFQKNDSQDDDLDFSVIDKKPPQQAKLNFSVQSLLSHHSPSQSSPIHSSVAHRNSKSIIRNHQFDPQLHEVNAQNGSFLNDLQKLQHSLSFQTVIYNVYQQQTQNFHSSSLNPTNKSYLHAKSNSHLKTTKQESSHSNNLAFDDYGYLVLDFGPIKRKKSSKFSSNEKLHLNKLYTQQGTLSSQKLKASDSSGALTENASIIATGKIKHKNSSLNKLLSPRLNKKGKKIFSKNQDYLKVVKSKSKDTKKYLNNQLHKKQSISKPKSIKKHLNVSKNTNGSTTIAEKSNKTNKSYAKSTRQAKAYSQYYGMEEIGDSERLVMKSNCLHQSASEKNIVLHGKGNSTYFLNKNNSKSKCKNMLHSPSGSSKDLTMRFKKKKNTLIV